MLKAIQPEDGFINLHKGTLQDTSISKIDGKLIYCVSLKIGISTIKRTQCSCPSEGPWAVGYYQKKLIVACKMRPYSLSILARAKSEIS